MSDFHSDPIWADLNPRYVAYCLDQGAGSPQEMMERDTLAYPGGKMAGFILWMKLQWQTWGKLASVRGRKLGSTLTQEDHDDFDKWLWEK